MKKLWKYAFTRWIWNFKYEGICCQYFAKTDGTGIKSFQTLLYTMVTIGFTFFLIPSIYWLEPLDTPLDVTVKPNVHSESEEIK